MDFSTKKKKFQTIILNTFINFLFQHPQYDSETFLNDIALIKLNSNIIFSNTTSPICLPGGILTFICLI